MEVNSQKKVVLIIYSCCKTYRLIALWKQCFFQKMKN